MQELRKQDGHGAPVVTQAIAPRMLGVKPSLDLGLLLTNVESEALDCAEFGNNKHGEFGLLEKFGINVWRNFSRPDGSLCKSHYIVFAGKAIMGCSPYSARTQLPQYIILLATYIPSDVCHGERT